MSEYNHGKSRGPRPAVTSPPLRKDFGLPADTLKDGLCCSGMYDLYPVSLSARAGYVKFTPEMIEKLSPQCHLDKLVALVLYLINSRIAL